MVEKQLKVKKKEDIKNDNATTENRNHYLKKCL